MLGFFSLFAFSFLFFSLFVFFSESFFSLTLLKLHVEACTITRVVLDPQSFLQLVHLALLGLGCLVLVTKIYFLVFHISSGLTFELSLEVLALLSG